MPFENPAFKANGTIRRCRFVKQDTSADNLVLEADANEAIVGISDESAQDAPIPNASANAAEAGDMLRIYTIGKVCLLEVGTGGWTPGAELKSDADGKGVLVATTGTTIQEIGAIALKTGVAGDLSPVIVFRGVRRPDAA